MPEAENHLQGEKGARRAWGIVLALSIGVPILFLELEPGRPEVARAAGVAAMMAILWITEAVSLAITALIPVVLFPALGVMNGKLVSSQYFNHIIFLFIGGFMVALAMERWKLHRRIALRILLFFGNRPANILLGFMVATAFLSMWISNTATAMMMVTIAMPIITRIAEGSEAKAARKFAVALLLGVAYSASIGGISTLVGTPPNMSFIRIFEIQFPDAPEITFAKWFAFAFPITVVFLFTTWFLLRSFALPRGEGIRLDPELISGQYRELGKLSFAEWVVGIDFLLLVFLWLFRREIPLGDSFTIPGWSSLLPVPGFLNDGTVAIALALPLFFLPARDGQGSRIMDWATTARLPWHIVLLFGGGFALAAGFTESGLSQWIGNSLGALGDLHPILLVALFCLVLTFVTELTSNTATTEMILPILAGVALSIEVNPLLLMIPVTLSCSCAFMMPVATPPNAIVFGTDRIRIRDMARVGLVLNFIGLGLIVTAMWLLGEAIWGIELDVMPEWAKAAGNE